MSYERRTAIYRGGVRVVFLLGSGISLDAGMPSVGDVTRQVFDGTDVVRHSDATYYIADEAAPNYAHYRVDAESAIAFCGELAQLANNYFRQ